MTRHLDKLASVGAMFAAAACPICFPKLALLGGLIGLGAFSAYEAQLFIAAQLLVIVALAGHALAYRQARRGRVFGGALVSGAVVFAGLYALGSEWLTYAGVCRARCGDL
jgi:mercuric ion transport protein